METQASFTYEYPCDAAESNHPIPGTVSCTLEPLADPFLINTAWGPLFRQICVAGKATVQARRQGTTRQAISTARQTCVDLLSMQLTDYVGRGACSSVCMDDAQSRKHCRDMGEAHRPAVAALLLHYFPTLKAAETVQALLPGTGEPVGALIAQVMLHLRGIPTSCIL